MSIAKQEIDFDCAVFMWINWLTVIFVILISPGWDLPLFAVTLVTFTNYWWIRQ